MRTILLLLLSAPAFAQVTYNAADETCGGLYDSAGTEYVVPCAPVLVIPPPPVETLNVVALGDSWVDPNVGGYWSIYLSDQIGADLDNHGDSGATTGEILQQTQGHIANHSLDGEYFIWFLPNDCGNVSNPYQRAQCVLTQVPGNAGAMVQALSQAGVGPERVHMLSQVDGGLICTSEAQAIPAAYRTMFTDQLNAAIESAIQSYGYSLHDVNGLFNQMFNERGCSIWKDGKHFSNQTNHEVADYLEATFF